MDCDQKIIPCDHIGIFWNKYHPHGSSPVHCFYATLPGHSPKQTTNEKWFDCINNGLDLLNKRTTCSQQICMTIATTALDDCPSQPTKEEETWGDINCPHLWRIVAYELNGICWCCFIAPDPNPTWPTASSVLLGILRSKEDIQSCQQREGCTQSYWQSTRSIVMCTWSTQGLPACCNWDPRRWQWVIWISAVVDSPEMSTDFLCIVPCKGEDAHDPKLGWML